MYNYNVKEISEKEYYVIETRFVNEPEYILAKCSGPAPAWDIVFAMRLAQTVKLTKDGISNSITGMKSALEIFKHEMKVAREA